MNTSTYWQFQRLLAVGWLTMLSLAAAPRELHLRSRTHPGSDTNAWEAQPRTVSWEMSRTAVVVCDMWDKHHCPDATERVGEMAPRMNAVLIAARRLGALIIHCPSDTMNFYTNHPGRALAQAAPHVATTIPLENWCSLKPGVEAPLPIDDSDGGCDGCPTCPSFKAWSRQHPALEILPGDAITDSAEAFYLMRQRGITNVIVMGVHINMCVLGRPFSIRQMIRQGQNVLLMRDLTDSMYNHRMRPWVNHFRGTELVVEHIEQYWCPSVTSADFLGGAPFRFMADRPKHVALVIGEQEYQTSRTLPEFAQRELVPRGYRISLVAAPDKESDGNFQNWEALRSADVILLSARRRQPPAEMMALFRAHLAQGKPLIGIRTASHAFEVRGQKEGTPTTWPDFGTEILGADYQDHYPAGPGKNTVVHGIPSAAQHPILNGVHPDFRSTTHLYRSRDLKATVTALLTGVTEDGTSQVEPIAWINQADHRRVFYTSLGDPQDFANSDFRRLLRNAVIWGLDDLVPPADSH